MARNKPLRARFFSFDLKRAMMQPEMEVIFMAKPLAQILRSARQNKGLTQEQLAAQLYVTRQAVSSWEKGRTQPDLDTLRNVCTALDLSPEELLLGKPHTEDSSAALIRGAAVCFWGMTALCLAQGILAIALRMPAPGFYAGALFLCQVTHTFHIISSYRSSVLHYNRMKPACHGDPFGDLRHAFQLGCLYCADAVYLTQLAYCQIFQIQDTARRGF